MSNPSGWASDIWAPLGLADDCLTVVAGDFDAGKAQSVAADVDGVRAAMRAACPLANQAAHVAKLVYVTAFSTDRSS